MDYPTAIKEIREKLLLTQTELAAKLHVSYATINRWENSKNEPSIRAKRKIRDLRKQAGLNDEER